MDATTEATKLIAFNIDKNASIATHTLQNMLSEAAFWAANRGLTTPRLHSIGEGADPEGNAQHAFAFLAESKAVNNVEDILRLLQGGLKPTEIIARMKAQRDSDS